MKKVILLITVVIAIIFTGCGKSADENKIFDEDIMNELAQTTVNAMINGDFAFVADNFDETVKKQLNAESLKDAWDSTVSSIGKHIGNQSISSEVNDKQFICKVIENYEQSGLQITIVYNSKLQISGLNLSYVSINSELSENDAFIEEKESIVADKSMPLEALLTLPKNLEKPPVVLLVQGSGSTDKNETIYTNTPFKDIAYGLAKKGIATLRYDRRYFKYPEKAKELGVSITLRDEILDDVKAAIDLLKKDNRVDSSRIYVLGHSLGGMLAPVIVTENEAVQGIISMAGTLRPVYEVSYDQNKDLEKQLQESDLDEKSLDLLKTQMKQIEKDIEILRGDISNLPNDTILMGLPVAYQKSAKEYSGMNFIDKVNVPILVLQGKEDFQVYPDKDFSMWKEVIGKRDNVTFKLYDNLNHLMMETNGKKDVGDYQIKGTVNQEVIDDIAKFILDTEK